MISKAEPCLVVSIQNQLTFCIGTVIVQQIPVARKLKLLFGDHTDTWTKIAESFWKQNYADTVHIVNFVIMNSLFKLFEILAWIIRSGRFDAKKIIIIKKILQIVRQNFYLHLASGRVLSAPLDISLKHDIKLPNRRYLSNSIGCEHGFI